MGPDSGTLVAWVVTDVGGKMIYEAVVLPGQSTDVAGLGDRAAFVDNTGLLILKGDRLVTLSVAADLRRSRSRTSPRRSAAISPAGCESGTGAMRLVRIAPAS